MNQLLRDVFAVNGTVSIGGVPVWFGHTEAAGPPILFLHGGLGESGVFAPMIRNLAPTHEIWAYDRQGHGKTPNNGGEITYEGMLADLLTFVENTIGTRVHVVGHSDGANLGLLLALRRPDLVSSLAMFSGNLSPDQVDLGDLDLDTLTESFRQSLERIAPERADEAPDTVQKIVRLWTLEPRLAPEDLHSLKVPVLVASADQDMISAQHTAQIANAIPGAVLSLVSDATHMLIEERADRCSALVKELIDGANRDRS